jgi:hypothetical protein
MLFKATLWTRELSLKKSTGIFTYPHQTVMDLSFTLLSKEGWAVSRGRIRKPAPGLRARRSRERENGIMVAFDEKCLKNCLFPN